MSIPQNQHREGAFRPINTLSSTQAPAFHTPFAAAMANEHEPPGDGPQTQTHKSLLHSAQDPQFGKSSPLRNPLNKDSSRVFNVPKPTHSRPEHHRPLQPHTHASSSSNPPFRQPFAAPNPIGSSPDFVEIPRPAHFAPPSVYPSRPTMFSAANNFRPAGSFKPVNGAAFVDLTTRDDDDGFDPNKVDTGSIFDPSNFMDAAKTNENIKALLEGAFDDDDDKPRTRLRKKKLDAAAAALVDGVQNLQVDDKADPLQRAESFDDEDDGSVEGMNVKLLPHQIDGLTWMIDKEIGTRKKNGVLPKGGILADDMGLGKTIQALSLILSNPRPSSDDLAENPKLKIPETAGKGTLVVAPLALIKQWESEIKTKVDTFPKLRVLVHHGPSRTKRFEDLKKQDIVITTYQTLTSEHEGSSNEEHGLKVGCFGVHWYRVILDEAHSIKNRNAKMTKAAYDLESVYRWCMTGTPMQNNLEELQSLISFLRIKPYNDIRAWREQISKPMKNGRGGLAMKRLQYFLRAFMKRRTKDILKKDGALNFGRGPNAQNPNNEHKDGFKIVARNVKTVVAHFDRAERDFYDKLEARTSVNLEAIMDGEKQNYIGALVLLLRLRQTCNHPQLSRGNLSKEKDSIPSKDQFNDPQPAPRSKTTEADEVDDIANMLGALSVATKACDSCGSQLDRGEMDSGAIRCTACEDDFARLRHNSRLKKKRIEPKSSQSVGRRKKQPLHTRRIIDSDDEDDDGGEWLVPKTMRDETSLGKAGGTDDENAEGGGQWLGADDSDTGDESTNTARKLTQHSKDARSDERDETSDEESNNDPEDDSEIPEDRRSPPSSTKIRRLIEILEHESDEHKFIVFSEFTSMLDLAEPFLREAGFRFARYDGKMKNDDREASLERLRNDPRTRILLCSLRCGSLGLNLTAASRVVIMEPFWNPFVEEQAIDRVHRLNQTQDVTVYRLTIANSVEQRIIDLQEKKRSLANAAIEGGKAIAKLSMQDIMDLFKRDAERESDHEDALSAALGSGRPAGVLQSPLAKPQPPLPPSTRPMQPASQQALNRDQIKKAPKFHIPPSLRPEYEAVYGRRW